MELITLKVFDNSIDAHFVKSYLENEGIECFLFDENFVALNPVYNVALGGIKLKIKSTDAEKAREILINMEQLPNVDEKNELIKCPQCNSSDLYTNFKSMKGIKGIFTAILSFILMIFPFYYQMVYKCKNCGTEFKPELN